MYRKVNIILFMFILGTTCYSFYVNIDTARTEGMCSSGISDVSSVEAVVKNPALAYTEKFEFLVDYKKFFLKTKNVDVEGFIPADISNVLIAFCFPLDEKVSAGVTFDTLQTVENFYSQKMFSVVVNFKTIELENMVSYVGIKPKILYTIFDNNEIKKNFLDIAFSIDSEKIKCSLLYQAAAEAEERSFTVGSSYLLKNNFSLNTDITVNNVTVTPVLGIEFWYKNLALRTGINTTKLSFGFGVELENLALDVSTVIPYRFFEVIPSLRITVMFKL